MRYWMLRWCHHLAFVAAVTGCYGGFGDDDDDEETSGCSAFGEADASVPELPPPDGFGLDVVLRDPVLREATTWVRGNRYSVPEGMTLFVGR